MPLAAYAPELADRETRSVYEFRGGNNTRRYTFEELFCDEPGCDCRRLYIHVISDEEGVRQPRATLTWGWEDERFYRSWASFPLRADDVAEILGPALIRSLPQSEEAEELLARLRTLLADEAYAARIISHYYAFRAALPATDATIGMNRAQRRRAASNKRKLRH